MWPRCYPMHAVAVMCIFTSGRSKLHQMGEAVRRDHFRVRARDTLCSLTSKLMFRTLSFPLTVPFGAALESTSQNSFVIYFSRSRWCPRVTYTNNESRLESKDTGEFSPIEPQWGDSSWKCWVWIHGFLLIKAVDVIWLQGGVSGKVKILWPFYELRFGEAGGRE